VGLGLGRHEQDNDSSALSITLEFSPTDILSILPAQVSQPSGHFTLQRDQDRCYQVWRCGLSPLIKAEDQPVDLTAGPDVVVLKPESMKKRRKGRAHVTVKPRNVKYGRRLPKYLEQNYLLY